MLEIAEPELSIIRLTNLEREELKAAEGVIRESIGAFMRCGAALSLIRRKRLYREKYASFDSYITERWGTSKAAGEQLISCYHIAEGLQGAGIKVGAGVLQSAMVPLASVPGLEGLRAAVWDYAVSLCPEAESPPGSLMRRITGLIREALDGNGGEGAEEAETERARAPLTEGHGRPLGKGKKSSGRDERFLRAIVRLSGYRGFCVPLIASQIQSEKMAAYAFRACERLKVRLGEVEEAIVRVFPSAPGQKT
jgi:hypothetical protein